MNNIKANDIRTGYVTPMLLSDEERATPLMHLPEIEFMKLSDEAVEPIRAHTTDAGLDLYTATNAKILPRSTVTIPTDLAINLPPGFEAQIRPRSGVTSKTPLRVALGTIDSGYHGNIGIIVDNLSDEAYEVPKHYKLAQLVISPIVTPQVRMVSEFNNDTERGNNGFGSSGV